MTDSDLEEIARADYSYCFDQNRVALRAIRDTGRVPARLTWEPGEVLELTRWETPKASDLEGQRQRAFACAALLRAHGDCENDGYLDGENCTLAIALESAGTLGKAYERALGRCITWLLTMSGISIERPFERPFFVYALLLLEATTLDDDALIRLAAWMDHEEDFLRNDPWTPLPEDAPSFLLGLTFYDLSHDLWRQLTRERLGAAIANRPAGPGRDALARLMARVAPPPQ